ncbi:MAG TPA: aldehyde dehydrogenase family protein, partial [Candidatus Saccharimonadaceae bacterium]|nr:aldehyde dehydrogenase family protein [Candidatus Saccharimonadaceae bacterium]
MTVFANVIEGRAEEAGDRQPDINPSNLADVVGEAIWAAPADVERAIAAARAAWPRWSATTPQQRFDILDRAGTEILARKEELGRLLSRENGKPLPDGIGEAARAGFVVKYFAGEAVRIGGEKFDSVRSGIEVDVTREPLGVVGIITPWNFPLAIPAWKIAPALAFGNTVVFKPSELTPASTWMLTDIFQRAGLPPGVLNLVNGDKEAVDTLLEDPRVQAISFVGSTPIAEYIYSRGCAKGKRIQALGGAK